MHVTNILFDLDGTLTDPKEGITRSIQFSLGKLGAPAQEADDLTWCIGPPLRDSFARLLDTSDDELLDQALLHYRARYAVTGMFENILYDEVSSSLGKIREAGFGVFLATSKPKVFATKILEHFDLAKFFHGIHGSELDGRLTDKGELIAHILQVENLNPGLTLIVGDRKFDILGGKKNGIKTAAVTYGYGSQAEIADCGPDAIFESFPEVAAFLQAAAGHRISFSAPAAGFTAR
jgi:phosphoglycolate phosphatase